jgi:hypothetical protein
MSKAIIMALAVFLNMGVGSLLRKFCKLATAPGLFIDRKNFSEGGLRKT